MLSRRGGIVAALVSSACFGVLAVFTAIAYDHGAEPLQLMVLRFVSAALLLGLWTSLRRPGGLRVPAGDLRRFAALSLCGYGAAAICFSFAVKYLEASLVAILLYTYPAIVALLERAAYGIRLTQRRVFAVVMTFIGCVLIVNPFGAGGQVSAIGVVLGLGAGAGYAVFTILSHRWLPGRSRSVMMTYLFVFTAALALAAAAATGSTLYPENWDSTAWLMLGGLVLLPTFAAILLYWRALRVLGASQAAVVSTFEPLFTIAFAAALLGERLGPVQWIGAAFIMAGVVISEFGSGVPDEIPAV